MADLLDGAGDVPPGAWAWADGLARLGAYLSGSDLLPEPEPEAEPEPQPNTSAEQEETAASPPAMAPPFVNFVAITRYTQLEPGLAEDAVQERCFEAWAHLDAKSREVYGGTKEESEEWWRDIARGEGGIGPPTDLSSAWGAGPL